MLKSLIIPLLAVGGVAAQNNATYDYIVVGSGPGGGPLAANLARAGLSVLLLEAGDDQSNNPNISNLFSFNEATNDEKTRWDFWVKHSEDPARELKYDHMTWRKPDGNFYVGLSPPNGSTQLGVWYPRAGTLGGCAMHNAGVTFLPYDDDWNDIMTATGDKSWAAAEMWKHFRNIEKNSFLPVNTTGHGFKGYLDTMVVDSGWINQKGGDGAEIFKQLAAVTGQTGNVSELIYRDINKEGPGRDEDLGFFGLSTHATKTTKRAGPAYYVKSTLADAKKFPLTLQLNSLVTKVLFSNDSTPTAIGVEVRQGKSLYAADPRRKATEKGTTQRIYARKEVIISGGAFNSPQILKLSGIGPADELKKFNIPVVKDLPGVGERMADNYETSYIAMAANKKPLSGVGAPVALLMKTPNSPTKRRNVYAFCGAISFEGFWPGMPTDYGPSEYECALVHMGPKSQEGYVRLRSSDPTEMPEVNFRFFEKNGDQDLSEMLEAIKTVRSAFEKVPAPVAPWDEVHPCKGTNAKCSDADQKEWIKNQAYSHHPTSTCAIGPATDKMAVLDSKFRVHGIKNLRVVDASAFPKIPGAFPVVPTMLLAEKATADILGTAAA